MLIEEVITVCCENYVKCIW